MVLGPDLVGWRMTEARLWAMLRDEEALQVCIAVVVVFSPRKIRTALRL